MVGAIIVAGGRGARLGAGLPKQLLDLGGQTMLRRTIGVFDRHPAVDRLVVVLPGDLLPEAQAIVGPTSRPCDIVEGGETRQESVRCGLAAMPAGPDVILVHDAARPFAPADLIDRVIAAAVATGAAVPALPASETVKRVDPAARVVRETIARDEIWLAQTPQGFRRAVLEAAMAVTPSASAATDDAMLVERAGHAVAVVPGDAANVKITTADDLAAARGRLAGAPRVGTGYDLHRLVPGRKLMLAGVEIPFGRGPEGHSDGDVVCHAAIDAMLGAVGAGDIGRHFSNSDPQWKDAPGLDLLARARTIVEDKGWVVSNIDVTVILERPKLSPHVPAIIERLAGVLGVPADRVSVKAKTNEGVDAVGRCEAIASHAVAVLVGKASA